MNLTPEYKKYIEECREKGMTDIQIRGALISAGWSDMQVRDLFDSYRSQNSPLPSPNVPMVSKPRSESLPQKLEVKSLEKPEVEFDIPIVENKPEAKNSPDLASSSITKSSEEKNSAQDQINHPPYNPAPTTNPNPFVKSAPETMISDTFDKKSDNAATQISSDKINSQPRVAQSTSGISSYQPGSQLNTPLNRSYYAETLVNKAPLNNEQIPVVETQKPEVVEIKERSSIKKVIVWVLALAFLIGGGAYAYMQYFNPFVLKADDAVLASAIQNLTADGSNLKFTGSYSQESQNIQISSDVELDIENSIQDRWSLALNNLKYGESEPVNIKVKYIPEDVYFYPGKLASYIGNAAEQLLFEKWVSMKPNEAAIVLYENTGLNTKPELITQEIPKIFNDIRFLGYSIESSEVRQLKKVITLDVTSEKISQPVKVTLVINRDMVVESMMISSTYTSGEETYTINSNLTVTNLGDDYSVIPPQNVVGIDEVMSAAGIEGLESGLMSPASISKSKLSILYSTIRSIVSTSAESNIDYGWICAEGKINTTSFGGILQKDVDSLITETKQDGQDAIDCFSNKDAYAISVQMSAESAEGDSYCIDQTGEVKDLSTASPEVACINIPQSEEATAPESPEA